MRTFSWYRVQDSVCNVIFYCNIKLLFNKWMNFIRLKSFCLCTRLNFFYILAYWNLCPKKSQKNQFSPCRFTQNKYFFPKSYSNSGVKWLYFMQSHMCKTNSISLVNSSMLLCYPCYWMKVSDWPSWPLNDRAQKLCYTTLGKSWDIFIFFRNVHIFFLKMGE